MEITVATILNSVGEIVSSGVEWVGDFASTVVSNPLLMLFAGLPLVGLGVGLIKRLVRVN